MCEMWMFNISKAYKVSSSAWFTHVHIDLSVCFLSSVSVRLTATLNEFNHHRIILSPFQSE